jgi:copper transport protein
VRGLLRIIVLLVGLAAAPAAFAHASLVKAEPADGAMLAEPPARLTLTFNEPVSPLVMRLIGPSGEVIAPEVSAENTVVTLTPPRLRQGSYALSWRVVSADGHPVGGAVLFAVGQASATAAPGLRETGDSSVGAALWSARLVLYLGLIIGIGGAFFQAWLAEGRPRSVTAILGATLGAGLVAAVLSLGLQGLDALALPLAGLIEARPWQTGLATSYGTTVAVAAAALLAGIVALVVAARPHVARGFALAALLGIGLALSLSGHASTAAPRWLMQPSVFLHGVCAAVWIGALMPLMAAVRLPGGGTVALARFSRLIPYPFALLIATGVVLAVVQVETPSALWTSGYGIVLLGKLLAVAALLVLAALNRFVLVPQLGAGGSASDFVISVVVEVMVAIAILALVATWRFTPPPRALATAAPVSVHLHGERAMAQLAMAPRRAGGARVDILVLDGELRPLAAKEVTLVIANPAAGIEPIRRSAARDGDVNWHIDDLVVPVAGRWRLRVEILINDFERVSVEDDAVLARSP